MRSILALLITLLPMLLHAEIHIRANLLGYRPPHAKTAIAFSTDPLPTEFTVRKADDSIVLRAAVRAVAGSWGAFPHHVELDFTPLQVPGRYVLEIGDTRSRPFTIGDDIYDDVPNQLLEFMRQQRCGYNPWLDAVCHRHDGRTAFGPLPAGTYLDASGGWHDVGDMLKYLLTSSNATAQLLLAYEIAANEKRPASVLLADHYNSRGQPHPNQLPDLLDEAKWGLDWMLKLHPATDALYHQVADDRDHIGFRKPPEDPADYGWGAGSYRVVYFADGKPQGLSKYLSKSDGVANLAGRYAAAMALGASIFRRFPAHAGYASTLQRAAVEVYRLGKADEGVQQGNSFSAPYRYDGDDMGRRHGMGRCGALQTDERTRLPL